MTGRRRRHGDRGWRRLVRENAYRDVWLLLITLMALFGIWSTHRIVVEQAKGRHFAVGVTCATLSAISESGRDVIAGAPRFESALERLGFPAKSVGSPRARAAARLYVETISEAVQRQVGGKGANLIRKDGAIDCRELQRLSNTVVRP